MATITRSTKKVMVEREVPGDEYVLTLTLREAEVLRTVLGCFTGWDRGPGIELHQVYQAMYRQIDSDPLVCCTHFHVS